jgi:hypothetical protein
MSGGAGARASRIRGIELRDWQTAFHQAIHLLSFSFHQGNSPVSPKGVRARAASQRGKSEGGRATAGSRKSGGDS